MPSIRTPRQVPIPRVPLSPRFVSAVRASKRSVRQLSELSGFPHREQLSAALSDASGAVPMTPLNVRRLRAVADLVGFPREQVFISEEPA